MSTLAVVLSVASNVALLASGYLVGARRGRLARAALSETCAARERALRDAERASRDAPERDAAAIRKEVEAAVQPLLSGAKAVDTGALLQELRAVMRTLSDQERGQDALRSELRQGLAGLAKQSPDPDRLKLDMQKLMAPLLRKQEDTAALRDTMNDVLRPLLERERLGKELAVLKDGEGLRELPRMLDAIAEKGAFSTVVLSDDVGLPLAANAGAVDVDALAGVAAFLLTLIERAERGGAPTPLAFVVKDSANQVVVHRIFEAGARRFTLTAISRGLHVVPDALDGALIKLEKVLSRRAPSEAITA